MKWTTDKPTEPGWYWLKDRTQYPDMVYVQFRSSGDIWVRYHETFKHLNEYGNTAQWQGPLKPEDE